MEKKIMAIIRQWKHEAGVKTTIKFSYRGKILTVYSSQCGLMVGRAGTIINKYVQIFKDEGINIERWDLVEVSSYDI